MENKYESLERKLNKPDWKQWIPIYGLYQVRKDLFDDKQTIIDRKLSASYVSSVIYQGAAIGGTIYGLSQLAEKLF